MENRIKDLRSSRGITQKQLSNYLGIKQNTLSYWERGVYDADNASLQKIADYFGVSIDYLLCHEAADQNVIPGRSLMSLSAQERDLIVAFRSHPEMWDAVGKLLGVELAQPQARNA